MTWHTIVSFMGHGGFKVLFILAAFVIRLLKSGAKNAAKKAAQERPPLAKFPNEMPSQMQTTSSSLKKSQPQSKSDSPWAKTENPFDS